MSVNERMAYVISTFILWCGYYSQTFLKLLTLVCINTVLSTISKKYNYLLYNRVVEIICT